MGFFELLLKNRPYVRVVPVMTVQLDPQIISPVKIEERNKIEIRAGDTVRVYQKIEEKDKTRIQVFEGIVLARKHGNEPGATFTVRRVSGGVGVEKIFPLYSPVIDKIEIVKRSNVRRAKLYYIRDKVAREIKRQMRNARLLNIATVSETEERERSDKEELEKEKAKTETETQPSETKENKEPSSSEELTSEKEEKGEK